jgi:hypothetical protein
MDNYKFTKGKWNYSGGDNSSIDIVLENNSTISIDRYDRYGSELVGTREEMEANALLISKAPEMLEMLKSIISDFEGDYVVDEVIVDQPYKWLIDRYKEAKQLIKEATELKSE